MNRLLCAAAASILCACAHETAPSNPLRLNDIQVVGSHNSYRIMPPPEELAALDRVRPNLGAGLTYDHPPIARQLDLGVRQLELDIAADPRGDWRGSAEEPGFKVTHIPGLDERTHCNLLRQCLADIRAWSQRNPRHLPIIITIDAKDTPSNLAGARAPIPIDAARLDELDAEFVAGLGRDKLIVPDQVRANAATLREAVLGEGWPLLENARGKIMVIFDVRPALAELYRAGRPNLQGRIMFAPYKSDQPEASVFIYQSAVGPAGDEIRGLVRQGFIIRTRSDANTIQARTGDRSMMEAAAASGAQIVSTDYYPGAPDPLGVKFVLTLPGDVLARCNPVRRMSGCALAPSDLRQSEAPLR